MTKLEIMLKKFNGMKGYNNYRRNENKIIEYLLDNQNEINDFLISFLKSEDRIPGGFRIIGDLPPLDVINDETYSMIINQFSDPKIPRHRNRGAAHLFSLIGPMSVSKFYKFIEELTETNNPTAFGGTCIALHTFNEKQPIDEKILMKVMDRILDDNLVIQDWALFLIAKTFPNFYRVPNKYEKRLFCIYHNTDSFLNTGVFKDIFIEHCVQCIGLLDITNKAQQDNILNLCFEHVSYDVYPIRTFQCIENMTYQLTKYDEHTIEFLLLELFRRVKIGDNHNVGQIKKILKKIEKGNLEEAIKVYSKFSESEIKWISKFSQRKIQNWNIQSKS